MENETPLTSVHDAMREATLNTKPIPPKSEHMIVRVDPVTKARVADICEQNGVTVSEFVRQCCAGLVRDYTGSDEHAG